MTHPQAEIINIGDEILYGQITNTNAKWMSEELDKIGVATIRHTVVKDDAAAILSSLSEAKGRAQIILITGGLGPTKDDITKKTLCQYFGASLITNQDALQHITAYFESRGREMIEANKLQATIPDNAVYLKNEKGTAPGMWFDDEGTIFISMPGVPKEMKFLMEELVIPKLQKHFETPFIYHKIIKTIGKGESFLAEMIADWEDALPEHIGLAYLPRFGMVRLRLTGVGEDVAKLKKDIDDQINKVLPLIERFVYGYDDDEIAPVIGRILVDKGLKIGVAESCTGGLISHLFTSHTGCSAFFEGAVTSYANNAKVKVLGVKEATLASFGAVSEETVKEMAEGVANVLGTDIGISTSGIAGPTGGTDSKPVGTIWVAIYQKGVGVKAHLYNFPFDREKNIQLTAYSLLDWLRKTLLYGD